MSSKSSKWGLFRDLVRAFAPGALLVIPGGKKLAPHVDRMIDAIDEAQQIEGATGAQKRAHVQNIVRDAAIVAQAAGANVEPDELVEISGHAIDTTIGAVNAAKKVRERAIDPAEIEHPVPEPTNADPSPADLTNR